MQKNTLITTLQQITPSYYVKFDVKPFGTMISLHGSILHLTTGGNGHGDPIIHGERIPAVWFTPGTTKLLIATSLNNTDDYSTLPPNILPLNQYTEVEIYQKLDGNNQYKYEIKIAGNLIHSAINNNPLTFSNVKVYSGDPWYATAKAYIKNIMIDTFEGMTFHRHNIAVKGPWIKIKYQIWNEIQISMQCIPIKISSQNDFPSLIFLR